MPFLKINELRNLIKSIFFTVPHRHQPHKHRVYAVYMLFTQKALII